MTEYIVNLTGHLINKGHLFQLFYRFATRKEFIHEVMLQLECGEVGKMTPERLASILAELAVDCVVHTTTAELVSEIRYTGNPLEVIHEFVAYCLACVIYDRLDADSDIFPKWYGGYKREKQPESLRQVEGLIRDSSAILFGRAMNSGLIKNSDAHILVPVHYMGTEGEASYWEVGLVPRLVKYNASGVYSDEVILFRLDSKVWRGPNMCEFRNGIWERLPD